MHEPLRGVGRGWGDGGTGHIGCINEAGPTTAAAAAAQVVRVQGLASVEPQRPCRPGTALSTVSILVAAPQSAGHRVGGFLPSIAGTCARACASRPTLAAATTIGEQPDVRSASHELRRLEDNHAT